MHPESQRELDRDAAIQLITWPFGFLIFLGLAVFGAFEDWRRRGQ